jgi:hypothetical protein
MKRNTFTSLFGLVGVLSVMVWTAVGAEGPNGRSRQQSLNHPLGTPAYQILNINNLWTWARSDGQSNHSPQADDGMYFPRGTKWVIYQDGLVWGAKPTLDSTYTVPPATQPIRVGGATYNIGTQAGWINGFGATAQAADPALAAVRIYRIRRDYKEMSQAELARDAAEFYEKLISDVTQADIDFIKNQYEKDWVEWPVDRGAPYIERNGQPGYQAPPLSASAKDLIQQNLDEPGVAGADPNSPADQVVWTVFNDLNRSLSLGLYGSEPLGLEVQMTMWGYKRTDAMGNLYFKRYRIINKGGVEVAPGTRGAFYLDSMYIAQWSDPDLGAFGDDLCGSDSVRSLGFVYNGNAIDTEFRKFNLPPPAVGYDFLAGPLVRGVPTDSAVFDLKRRYGYKNLPLTSFAYFSAGSGINDPPFSYEGALRWWRMLQGFVPDPSTAPWRLYPSGPFPASKYPLSGDPVTGTGFIDGLGTTYSFAPGDRRIVLNSGPFRLAPGDTQEVVVGTVAGLGSDRKSSISVMKFNDQFVQNTFNALFQVPKPPISPDVKVSELDGQVILEWGSNLTRVRETEETINQPGAYKFEGYNVYQLPSRSSRLSEGRRIATFDLPTDPAVVLDLQFDASSGQILELPVQFGTNSGVQRYFRFNRDYIRDIDKLNNGQEYYLVVTAYSVATQAGFLPRALESDVQVLTVRPRVPFGATYGSRFGDTLKVTYRQIDPSKPKSDGTIRPIVIDPASSTGHTYEVRFDTTGGVSTWKLVNTTQNRDVITGQTNQSGDENYKILESSIFLKVEGPLPGLKRQDQFDTEDSTLWGWKVTSGTRRFTWSNADGLGFEGFRGAAGWASPNTVFGSGTPFYSASELKAIEIRLANATPTAPGSIPSVTFDPNQPNVSYAYRYGRGFSAPPARPEFAPYIINAVAGYSYQDFTKSVPLAVYDIDANPPRRLAVGFLENNVAGGMVDGKYFPPDNSINNTAPGGPREWLFIFGTDYTETPNPAFQVEAVGSRLPIMYFITWNRRGDVPFTDQDAIALIPARVNTLNDVFSFSTPPPQKGAAYERASADKVGVFPNPYYAFNPAETNRLVRFVTFNNLPPVATVRIFNLAGHKVRTLQKNDPSQFLRWDLNNDDNFPVASGMYIAHIEMTLPSDGSKVTKILKIAVIQEQEVLDVF